MLISLAKKKGSKDLTGVPPPDVVSSGKAGIIVYVAKVLVLLSYILTPPFCILTMHLIAAMLSAQLHGNIPAHLGFHSLSSKVLKSSSTSMDGFTRIHSTRFYWGL
jgi:hypothetical protein